MRRVDRDLRVPTHCVISVVIPQSRKQSSLSSSPLSELSKYTLAELQ